jgi:hypothetical protein
MQIGVSAFIGTPIAAAALVSWNLLSRGAGRAGAITYLILLSAVTIGLDRAVGATSSHALGMLGFLLLVLAILTTDRLLVRAGVDHMQQGWPIVFVVAAIGLAIGFATRMLLG